MTTKKTILLVLAGMLLGSSLAVAQTTLVESSDLVEGSQIASATSYGASYTAASPVGNTDFQGNRRNSNIPAVPLQGVEAGGDDIVIPNAPMITPSSIIEISAIGMGVAPESTLSPAQALALAKRAAIVDAYRQIGEKMYGIRVNAQDTVRDMVLKNSTVKTKVMAIIRNAEIVETVYKDGLCQVSMELKLDGKRWYRILTGEEF